MNRAASDISGEQGRIKARALGDCPEAEVLEDLELARDFCIFRIKDIRLEAWLVV